MANQLMPTNIHWPGATEPVELTGDEAHVWAVPLAALEPASDKLWSMLSPDEHDRANNFFFEDPRRRFVTARSALRSLLGNYLDVRPDAIELTMDSNGKPRLAGKHAGSALQFNVSHSGDLAIIAVATDCEVGIDVEQLRDVGHLEQIARRFFHPLETEALLATPAAARDAAFLRCWTLKEAALKALGTGITGSLADFQVPLDESWQGWIEWPAVPRADARSRCWLQPLAPCDGYVAAIACVERRPYIRCFMYSV